MLDIPFTFQAIPLIKYINVFHGTVIFSFRLLEVRFLNRIPNISTKPTIIIEMDVSHGSLVHADSRSISPVCIFYMLSKILTQIDRNLIVVLNICFYLVMFKVTHILPFI